MNNKAKKIFITGASGFIGRHFLNLLNSEEYKVIALSREPNSFAGSSNVELVYGDLKKINEFEATIRSCDVIVNMAGEKINESEMTAVNIDSVKSLLKIITVAPHIKLIHISSGGVYGLAKHPDLIITEESECFPVNLYEQSKLKADETIRDFSLQHPFQYVILRPTNVFGEWDRAKKLLNLFHALKGNRFFYLEKAAKVNYVYAGCVAAVIKKIIDSHTFDNGIYNINAPVTIFEFIEKIKEHLNVTSHSKSIPSFFKPVVKLSAVASNFLPDKFQVINTGKYNELVNPKIYSAEKAKEKFQINAQDCLYHGLQNLINYYQSQRLL